MKIPALVLASLLLCCSCRARPLVIVAMDEAFAAARPGLSAALTRLPLRGCERVTMLVGKNQGAASVLEQLKLKRAAEGQRTLILASPLLARALAEADPDAALLCPEWSGELIPGMWTISTDFTSAYAALGKAAGVYMASLRDAGGPQAFCGIVFSEAPSRPRSCLEAFNAAYAESPGIEPPRLREIAAADKTGVAAAVQELLTSDIRFILIAIGAGTEAAIQAAARPGLIVAAQRPFNEALPGLSLILCPNDAALVKRAALKATELVNSAAGSRQREIVPGDSLPALLSPLDEGGRNFLKAAQR